MWYGNQKARFLAKEYQWAQVATLLIGIGAIVIGLRSNSMFALFLIALALTGPVLMFPLLSGVMGLKTDRRAFYMSTITTTLAWVATEIWMPEQYAYWFFPLSIIINGITFFGTHYALNKGFKLSESPENKNGNTPPVSTQKTFGL